MALKGADRECRRTPEAGLDHLSDWTMPPPESGSSRGEIEPVRVLDTAEAAMTLLAARMLG